jgi:hypothetical protein
VVHPSVGLRPPTASSSIILLQSLTFIFSCALSHRAKLRTGQVICALSTRSTFPKSDQGTEPTRTEHYIYSLLHEATQSHLHLATYTSLVSCTYPITTLLALSTLRYFYITFLPIYTFTSLTKRPNHG